MAYRREAIPMTLSDLQDHSPTASLAHLCISWQDCERHRASRGPSVVAEFLVPVILLTNTDEQTDTGQNITPLWRRS